MQILECPRVSFRRNGSFPCPRPNLLIQSLSRKSVSYDKIPTEPLELTVVKLDGSSFVIEVPRTATVAHLKQGVEAAFSDLPKKGPGISWEHVWGHFCLSYRGQKLLTDTDLIGSYGIKDDEKLNFERHVSIAYNMVNGQWEEEGADLNKPIRSDGPKDIRRNGKKVNNKRDIESLQDLDDDDGEQQGVMTICQDKLAQMFRRWFAYQRLATSDIMEEESSSSRSYSPRSFFASLGNFKSGRLSIDICD